MSDFNGKPFKEAMCIEAMRVFDSCSSQDCLEDLAFTFSQADQTVINAAAYIKSTCIDVTDVSFAISPVAFNHGFYAVDVTYTFRAQIEAYEAAGAAPTVVYGTSSFFSAATAAHRDFRPASRTRSSLPRLQAAAHAVAAQRQRLALL